MTEQQLEQALARKKMARLVEEVLELGEMPPLDVPAEELVLRLGTAEAAFRIMQVLRLETF